MTIYRPVLSGGKGLIGTIVQAGRKTESAELLHGKRVCLSAASNIFINFL